MVAIENEARQWHELLARAIAAEEQRNHLAALILKEHADAHAHAARWCSPACAAAHQLLT